MRRRSTAVGAARRHSHHGLELAFEHADDVLLHGGGAFAAGSSTLGPLCWLCSVRSRANDKQYAAGPRATRLQLEVGSFVQVRPGTPTTDTRPPTSKAGSVTHFEAEVLVEYVVRFLIERELDERLRRPRQLLHRIGFHEAPLIDFNYETEPRPALPGPSDFAPAPSHLNHLGNTAFQWIYWHALLPGRELPGLGPGCPRRAMTSISSTTPERSTR